MKRMVVAVSFLLSRGLDTAFARLVFRLVAPAFARAVEKLKTPLAVITAM